LLVGFGGVAAPATSDLIAWYSVPVSEDPTGLAFSWEASRGSAPIEANGRWYYPYRNWNVLPDHPDWNGLTLDTSRNPSISVELCGTVDVGAHVQGLDGSRSDLPDQDKVISTDNGGCPPGWGGYGQALHVGLTAVGNYAYEIVGPVKDQVPTTTVDVNGQAPHVELTLRPYCYHLSVGGKIDVRSPANCPGGGDGDYLKGSAVTLTAHTNPGDHFHSWSGTTSADGQTAYVAMTQDQYVTVDIGSANPWEKIAAGASSVTQRIISGLFTAVMDLAMAEMSVVTAINVAIKVSAELAHLAGAPSSVVDAMNSVSTDIDAQISVLRASGTCITAWANGGSQTLIPGSGPAGIGAKGANFAVTQAATKGLIYSGVAKVEANAGTSALNPLDLINGFGSNAGNYLQDPAQAWSSIGDIGQCMIDTTRIAEESTGWVAKQ
jgi:hypothetical protein